ncbi:PilN domain-containing protein [Candidatus Nitrosacidococcus tergens]|uniref:Type 4 fimbrial biogenesis protein PilN n=1 Tax=Candidatus Nitrosacidococcus tergens TaxID=553981 RepID=A0A7G1Q7B4_9GAMM|nr:PilN domain-containing protein [Candidatus Nitrosacidococcus tergens]CAB1274232.1 Type 4 fimbrial biogenesis protein PilN [Candidatus Nitrosacidococcus tergens]
MTQINLLPWRAIQRKQREKNFYIALGICAALIVSVVTLINFHIGSLINNQNQRNNYLQEEINKSTKVMGEVNKLDKEKEKILTYIEIIQQLQVSRPLTVQIFSNIAQSLPDGMYLESMERKSHTITLTGLAESDSKISTFIRHLDDSSLFEKTQLKGVEKIKKDQAIIYKQFTLDTTEKWLDSDLKEENKGSLKK